jgi:hypothetical protein
VAETRPPPFELWQQAGEDPQEYRRLMRQHGHLVPGKPEPLPCGWPRPRCIHDLSPASCAVCNGADKRLRAERPERGRWFFARYDGECSDCAGGFETGQRIRADGDGGYLCAGCGDD